MFFGTVLAPRLSGDCILVAVAADPEAFRTLVPYSPSVSFSLPPLLGSQRGYSWPAFFRWSGLLRRFGPESFSGLSIPGRLVALLMLYLEGVLGDIPFYTTYLHSSKGRLVVTMMEPRS